MIVWVFAVMTGCAGAPPPATRPAPEAPTPRPTGWSAEGIASWYGPQFHGRPTASGERFDMNAMTAAHRTLPFGTHVEVTNVANGRTATVRINDRGPFVGDRVIDVSRAAARELDMIGAGTARVRITVVSEPVECFYVQVGAYRNAQSAQELANTYRTRREDVRVHRTDGVSRVLLGPFDSRAQAERDRTATSGILRAC